MATDESSWKQAIKDGENPEIELESQIPVSRKDAVEEPGMYNQEPERADHEQEPTSRCGEEEPVSQQSKSSGIGSRASGASFSANRISKKALRIILVTSQIIILIIGVQYIVWWPQNINIFATERDNSESLGSAHDEEMLLQRWQASYLGLSLIFTCYGCWAEDRGWYMVSMFMNVGIMSLFPFRNFGSEMPYTLWITIFGVISVYICYMLSERVQDLYLQDNEVGPRYFKKQCLMCDLPDMSIYSMGICQAVTAIGLLFLGLLWMLLEDAMITEPVRISTCNGWPGDRCGRFYPLQAQEYYVRRLAGSMVLAGFVGFLGGLFRHRTLLIFAMSLTTVPFFDTLENSIYTMGAAEDVRFMCTDDWWANPVDGKIWMFWGEEWDCATQMSYHDASVALMILCSSFSLLHLWVSFRFSERLQSWERADRHEVSVNLGDPFKCLCYTIANPIRWYTYALLILSIAVMGGGVVQIYFGVVSDDSTQAVTNYHGESVVLLDGTSYIDTPIIYGIFAILSGICILIFVFTDHRSILCLVFCLAIETNGIGWLNCIWHEIDLEYGIMQFATNDISIYPVYVVGYARDVIRASIQVYWVFLGFNLLVVFFSVMAHEAIQDSEKMLNNNLGVSLDLTAPR